MYRPAFHPVTIALALVLCRSTWAALLAFNDTHHSREQASSWHSGTNTVLQCRDFPGLSREQASACLRYPQEVSAALLGLRLAISECQFQFRWHRWNCSSLRSSKNRNPHSTPLLNRGYRESAFAYAISAAGVMHAVSRACSLGHLLSCGCGVGGTDNQLHELDFAYEEPELELHDFAVNENAALENTMRKRRGTRGSRGQWQWGGCSHNLDFGARFSALFLDSRETGGGDLQAHINLHNNRAGRLTVLAHTQLRCKCHGLSGSCEVRTCWRAPPDFRRVGDALKSLFRAAVLVDQGNLGRRRKQDQDNSLEVTRRRRGRTWQPSRRRRRREPGLQDLLYFQRSPSFCEDSADFPGTAGRRCHKNSSGLDGCASLCCGRGYNVIRQRRSERCLCRFHWCCQVVCKNCTVEEWITECK